MLWFCLSSKDEIPNLVNANKHVSMRLHRFVTAVQLPLLACGYNPFKGVSQVVAQKDGAEYPIRTNLLKLIL